MWPSTKPVPTSANVQTKPLSTINPEETWCKHLCSLRHVKIVALFCAALMMLWQFRVTVLSLWRWAEWNLKKLLLPGDQQCRIVHVHCRVDGCIVISYPRHHKDFPKTMPKENLGARGDVKPNTSRLKVVYGYYLIIAWQGNVDFAVCFSFPLCPGKKYHKIQCNDCGHY